MTEPDNGVAPGPLLLLQTRLLSLWGSSLPLLSARRDCHCAVPAMLSLGNAASLGDCSICSAAELDSGLHSLPTAVSFLSRAQ